jgi:uncharacterized membrane protein
MALPPLELFSLEEKAALLPGGLFVSKCLLKQQLMFLLLFFPILATLYSLPLAFGWVAPNAMYGFRNRRTRSNRTLWYRANRIAGIAIIVAMAFCVALEFSVPRLRNTQAGHLTAGILQISAIIIANAFTTFRMLVKFRPRK